MGLVDEGITEFHIDTDEANAAFADTGDMALIINVGQVLMIRHSQQGPNFACSPRTRCNPTIRNAFYDAVGIKMNALPLTARRVLMEIKKNSDIQE